MTAIRPIGAALVLAAGCHPQASVTSRDVPSDAKPVAVVHAPRARPAELCEHRGLRGWTIVEGDSAVGITRGMCLGEETDGWHFVSQVRLAADRVPLHEFHLWLSGDGEPRRAELRTSVSVTHFHWDRDELRIEAHGDVRVLSSSDETPATRVWVIPSHALYVRELMLRLGIGAETSSAVHLTYVPSREKVVPVIVQFRRTDEGLFAEAAQGRFELRTGDEPTLGSLRIVVATDDQQRPVYRDVQSPLWEPSLPAIPQPSYTLPDSLRATPVHLPAEAESPSLAGEWIIAGADEGPRPAALILSGSGPQDRYGFVEGTAIDTGYHTIQDALARAGFLVARFDDPGTGQSDSLPDNAGFNAAVTVARRTVDWLARHPKVAPHRLVVIGHGEGAMTATILARERFGPPRHRHPLAGVILMAGVGRNVRDVMEWQLEQGAGDGSPREDLLRLQEIHESLVRGGPVPPEFESKRRWFAELFSVDPLTNLGKIRVPVLALQGTMDFQVDPTLDFEPIERLIKSGRAGGRGSEAHLLPGLDHLFKPEVSGSTVGHYGDLTRQVDPAVIEQIVQWAKVRVGGKPPP